MNLFKRNTYRPQPVETINEPKEGFAQIDFRDIDTVIERLTWAEAKLWLYLQKVDRFGDKWKDLPAPKELAIRLGLSKRTVEKAMFKLNELGLYTIRIKQWEGVNSSAARAHQTAKNMKLAKREREGLEPLQDKGGYLAANAVNLPNCGYLAANTVNLPQERLNSRDQTPEPLPGTGFESLQTITDSLDLIKTTTDSAAVAEFEIEEEGTDEAKDEPIKATQKTKAEEPTEEELDKAIAEIRRLTPEIEINPQVKRHLIRYWANFPAAIAHTKKAITEGWCKKPTGLLVQTLKNPPQEAKTATGANFREWFDQARKKGLFIGSTSENGEMWVFTNSGNRIRWNEVKDKSWEELEKAYGS